MRKGMILLVLCLSKFICLAEVVILPITVTGRVISLDEKVVSVMEDDLKEIRLTNRFSKKIYIFGKADTKPFLYKIESGITKTFRVNAKTITELYYVRDGEKYKLEKYSDIKN